MMQVVGYSVGIKRLNYKFGSHQVWSVLEHGPEGARARAQEHVDFLIEYRKEADHARLIELLVDE